MTDSLVAQTSWQSELLHLPLQSKMHWNYSLQRFNTLRVGGQAQCFIDVETQEDLSLLLPAFHQLQIPWFVIGKGSNLILSDEGWPGVMLRLSKGFKSWEANPSQQEIYVGAAVPDVTFAQRCCALGWGGLEFLIGIPGCIGGALAMNAGAHGAEISDYLKQIWWTDVQGESHQAEGASIAFTYRHSPLNQKFGAVITAGLFCLNLSTPDMVRKKIKEYQSFREEKQPRQIPNCGSVFKNPPGTHAAKLIESVGLKGHRIGEAQISEKHSNFIVNLGHAQAGDVLALMELAKQKVWESHQIALEPEVQIVRANSG